MKNILFALICAFTLNANIYSQITDAAPYCEARIASLTIHYDNHIKEVSIGTLSNTTGAAYYNGSEYVYYNNLAPVNLQKGTSIPLTITVSKSDGEMNALWVYIDYNLNNSFEESELVGQGPSSQIANAGFGDLVLNFNLNIPSSAQLGQTRMRIIYTSDFYLTTPAPVPCNSTTDMMDGNLFGYGEIEDYDVTISGQSAGIDDVLSYNEAYAYPNPGAGIFNLHCPAAARITVHNLLGEKLLELNLGEGRQLLDMSAYENGIYILTIQQGQARQTIKLIKR